MTWELAKALLNNEPVILPSVLDTLPPPLEDMRCNYCCAVKKADEFAVLTRSGRVTYKYKCTTCAEIFPNDKKALYKKLNRKTKGV